MPLGEAARDGWDPCTEVPGLPSNVTPALCRRPTAARASQSSDTFAHHAALMRLPMVSGNKT